MFRPRTLAATLLLLSASTGLALAHGDVAPQPVDTDALPAIDEEEWAYENPYRAMGAEVYATAIEIGSSGYNQNCARCHGLNVVSGGLAPDLRYLEANEDGDEWFVERFQNGYTQNGITKMPAFGELLGQKAAWAIRTYVETRPSEDALEEHSPRLSQLRDALSGLAAKTKSDGDYSTVESDVSSIATELAEIAGFIGTESGASTADSVASRSVEALNGTEQGLTKAVEILTVGLSAAQ